MINPLRERGVALVLVLWLLALLTVMALSYSTTMRTESKLTLQHLQSTQAMSLAEAGIWLGVHELVKPENVQTWLHDGSVNHIQFGDALLEVSITNEAGKIDLNTAREELLQALLDSTSLSLADSEHLLAVILDWRDSDNLKRQNGAEDDDYLATGLQYGAKDTWFNSTEELRMIPGMSDDLYHNIAPAITVFSHQTAVNPQYAPKRALLAVPGMTEEIAKEYIQNRRNEGPLTSMPLGIDERLFYGGRSNAFTIASTGVVDHTRMRIEAMVLLKPAAIPPISILSWRIAPPADYDGI